MKFPMDAQVPRRLARILDSRGHDARHTLDLSEGNRTTDARICEVADEEERLVVTKDRDFVDSFFLRGSPSRLLLLTTGNIRNEELIEIFLRRLPEIETTMRTNRFLELGRTVLLVRD